MANEAEISVKRIKEVAFNLNEGLFNHNDPSTLISMELQQRFGFNIESNSVDLTLRAYYRYPESDPMQAPIADIQVQNVFEIKNLQQYKLGDNHLMLPQHLITSIVALSISHTRAFLAKNLAGTVLQDHILTVLDAEAVANHFFPFMFGNIQNEDVIEEES